MTVPAEVDPRTATHASGDAPQIVVDLAALRSNLRVLAAHTGVPVIAVVKADGYGHGMVPAARAALEGGASWLAAATPTEALTLRAAGLPGRILCWMPSPSTDWAACAAADLDVTAYTVEHLDAIAAAGVRGARVQLKIDTGLNRGGSTRAAWPDLVARARAGERDGTWRITGIWSHLVSSDEPDDPVNDVQETAFREAVAVATDAGLDPEIVHLANSAAAILRPSARFGAVRCGIAFYGLDPAPGQATDIGLRPAMTVRAPLLMVKDLAPGDAVSYGHHWTATEPTTVGLVPLGYGDGVPRHATCGPGRPGAGAEVQVAGRRRPIRGRICMDQFVVDLAGDRPEVGETAILFGAGDDGEPTAQEWAEACGTINYEIVTRIGGRLRRTYIDSEEI